MTVMSASVVMHKFIGNHALVGYSGGKMGNFRSFRCVFRCLWSSVWGFLFELPTVGFVCKSNDNVLGTQLKQVTEKNRLACAWCSCRVMLFLEAAKDIVPSIGWRARWSEHCCHLSHDCILNGYIPWHRWLQYVKAPNCAAVSRDMQHGDTVHNKIK